MKQYSFCFSLMALFFSTATSCAEHSDLTKKTERLQRAQELVSFIQQEQKKTEALMLTQKISPQIIHYMATDNDKHDWSLYQAADFHPIKLFVTSSDTSRDGVNFISTDVD